MLPAGDLVFGQKMMQRLKFLELAQYWQRGQIPNALLPDYKNSGAPGKTRTETNTKKNGRKRQFGDGEGCQITLDIEKLFRITISKHLLINNPLKTTEAYQKFQSLYEQYYPNEDSRPRSFLKGSARTAAEEAERRQKNCCQN